MRIVEYNAYNDILVEFQDEYKAIVKTRYDHFKDGTVKNPYFPTLYGVGRMGMKFPKEHKLEYKIWSSMMCRCFNEKYYKKYITYEKVTCCDEWLIFENFYKWLHLQENFYTLKNSNIRFELDKDIIKKGNKIYSPEFCCLVPHYINKLFLKSEKTRGNTPIGVTVKANNIYSMCSNGKKVLVHLGKSNTIDEAFMKYKTYKEELIKTTAKENYDIGLITKKCFEAMNKYEVTIDD